MELIIAIILITNEISPASFADDAPRVANDPSIKPIAPKIIAHTFEIVEARPLSIREPNEKIIDIKEKTRLIIAVVMRVISFFAISITTHDAMKPCQPNTIDRTFRMTETGFAESESSMLSTGSLV